MPKSHASSSRRFLAAHRAFGILVIQLGLAACTVVGPNAIYSGRLAYNAAISETNNQQMLMVLVNNRYGETTHLLNIASVTANVSVRSSSVIQAGFGAKSNYDGNLVPFAGGVIYEENPTISYVPVAGEKYFRQITTPVPIDMVARLLDTQHDPEFIYLALVSAANNIRNPAFLLQNQVPAPQFNTFSSLMTALSQNNIVIWHPYSVPETGLTISSEGVSAKQQESLQQLYRLLNLPPATTATKPLHVPVVPDYSGTATGALKIETRSIMELVELMSSQVEVPAHDLDSGIAAIFPPGGEFARTFRVRYSSSKPDSAYVAVEHRNGWHYIHEADQDSKRAFKLLASLWSAAMSNTLGTQGSAPILTVPVSR